MARRTKIKRDAPGIAAELHRLRAAATDLRRVGQQMSNVCFNLSQGALDAKLRPTIEPPARPLDGRAQQIMAECFQAWDAAIERHRLALLPDVERDPAGKEAGHG